MDNNQESAAVPQAGGGEYPANAGDSYDLVGFMSLVNRRLIRPFERTLRDRFTNLQIITLGLLWQRGAMSITEISDRLYLPKQQTTKLITQLSDAGCVRRSHSSSDRRVVTAELTDETAAMLRDSRLCYSKRLVDYIAECEGAGAADDFTKAVEKIREVLMALPDRPRELSAAVSGSPAPSQNKSED